LQADKNATLPPSLARFSLDKIMELLIAEKPAMALDIARALGNDIVRRDGYFEVAGKVVSYAIGHLIGLEEPQGYDPKFARWRLADLPIVIPTVSGKCGPIPKRLRNWQLSAALSKRQSQ
jgi:DNA topoisomerase IA